MVCCLCVCVCVDGVFVVVVRVKKTSVGICFGVSESIVVVDVQSVCVSTKYDRLTTRVRFAATTKKKEGLFVKRDFSPEVVVVVVVKKVQSVVTHVCF